VKGEGKQLRLFCSEKPYSSYFAKYDTKLINMNMVKGNNQNSHIGETLLNSICEIRRISMANENVYHCVAYLFIVIDINSFVSLFLCGNKYAFILLFHYCLPFFFSLLVLLLSVCQVELLRRLRGGAHSNYSN
jgi:hypothetical protein